MTPPVDMLLFIAASSFAGEDERRAFLDFACRGDNERRKRVEELLEIQNDADEFFEVRPEMAKPAQAPEEDGDEGELGARIGPYRLIERLGAGGCGVVYLAEQHVPVKRKVALKIIRLGMDTENVIARFSLEREALALMDHPNIARVLDAGATASGRPYFAMELVDGEKITDFCDRNHLGIRARLELFILVCEAIQHAHQKGVIHRDIKPSNVLVREDERRAVPKVIDFGIAKATAGGLDGEATVTKSGQFIGTPAYMSPEQAEGGTDIDTRSDIYSLGALLCELLTGSPPLTLEHFKNRGMEEIRTLLREEETRAPSLRLKRVSDEEIGKIADDRSVDPLRLPALLAGDLDWIVMKAVDKDRQRRYETANALAVDVRRYLNEEPVLACPPSRRYLLGKMVRRNRIAFAAGSVALFGLLGGFGTSTWLFLREREARQEQARLRDVAEQARTIEARLREDAKAGDLAAQAAVLLKYNDKGQADRLLDRLLDGVAPERVPRSLETANTFSTLANWNLTKKRWHKASDRFRLLVHVVTGVDTADSDRISFELLPAVTAVSTWGEPGQYDQLRMLTIKRFSNSANPIVAEQVIKATLLEPAAPQTLEEVLPLAKVIEASLAGPQKERDPHMVAWRQFSLGLMAYRQGNFANAGDWARRSLSTATNSPPRAASNKAILAMVDLKQGRAPQARATLADLRSQVARWEAQPFRTNDSDGYLWSNWGIVRILLGEAERMAAEAG